MSNGRILQRPLPLRELACKQCVYFSNGRCEGESVATVESFVVEGDSVIGCIDTNRQKYFHDDLVSHSILPHKADHMNLSLGRFIPSVRRILNEPPRFKANQLFGVALSTLLEIDGSLRYKSDEHLRIALRLPPNARLGLIGTAQDRPLEYFWTKSDIRDFWSRLAEFRFEFATSLTFSVWDSQPRFDQIYNQQRNFLTHDILLSYGITSVPFCFFSNFDSDHNERVAWLKDRTDVQTVAVHAQFYDSTAVFKPVLNKMDLLQTDVGRHLQFLVVGASSAEKIDLILGEFPDAIIVTDQPIFKAAFGQLTLPDLSHENVDRRIRPSALAPRNIETFERYCSQPTFWNRAA